MEEKREHAKPEHILQFMTTEHFALQSARAATIADANGRTNIFLVCVSSSVVALAFIGQATSMGQPFFMFALVLFPSLFFLGFVTFKRTLQLSMEDLLHALSINRIRHYYTEIAPEMKDYFLHSVHDDGRGAAQDMAIRSSRFQTFVTTFGTVMVINSIIAGVWLSLTAQYFLAPPLWLTVIIGAFLFVVALAAQHFYHTRIWEDFELTLTTKFPTPPNSM